MITNEQKAHEYGRLMFEHTKLQNQMSEIQGSSINLNPQQLKEIEDIKKKMGLDDDLRGGCLINDDIVEYKPYRKKDRGKRS